MTFIIHILLVPFLFLLYRDTKYISGYVLLTNLIILLTSYYFSWESCIHRPISTSTFFYIFIFFFLGIAPIVQLKDNVSLWTTNPIYEDSLLKTNISIIVAIFVYEITYKIKSNHLKQTNSLQTFDEIENKASILIIISIISTAITLYQYRNSINFLIYREVLDDGVREKFSVSEEQSLTLLFDKIIRPIPVIALTLYYVSNQKKSITSLFIILTCAIVSNFPLSLSRNQISGLYFPLLLLFLFKNNLLKTNVIPFVLIFSICYLFPFFEQGRQIESLRDLSFKIDFEMFKSGHFDCYQNFARVIQYDIVSYGRQLLGVLIFFVPRSFWPNKPIGSGGYLAEYAGLDFDHISMCYFAEGYINFSIFGIISFTIILSLMNATLDYRYYDKHCNYLFKYIYLTYCSMLVFNMRGDLISCYAYSLALIFDILFVHTLTRKKVNHYSLEEKPA